MRMRLFLFLIVLLTSFSIKGQTDTISDGEEDYSMYENLNFVDEGAKRFCTPKVFDISPAKLISVGFDHQGAFDIDYGPWGNTDKSAIGPQTGKFNGASGMRIGANIPVIAKTNIVLQLGFNYLRTAYSGNGVTSNNPLDQQLREEGLRSTGINTTIFKPLNEQNFFIFQSSADLSGDYNFNQLIPLKYTRISAALIFGKKVNDRKMIGFGISRTYRVGELNYIPVMLFNWTAPNRKWGVEMLAPARANIRKTISPRNILLFGYELEGNSYRILSQNFSNGQAADIKNIELRRSELRFRATWETSLHQFLWMSVQLGYRYGYGFQLDQFSNDKEFFRGFFGDQAYFQENNLNGTWYAQVSLNLVSP
jgi:hypothetical protein